MASQKSLVSLEGDNKVKATYLAYIVLAVVAALTFINPHFAYADDLFSSGTTTVEDTVGEGSLIYYVLEVFALVVSVIIGLREKNWIMAITSFSIFSMFVGIAWSVIS